MRFGVFGKISQRSFFFFKDSTCFLLFDDQGETAALDCNKNIQGTIPAKHLCCWQGCFGTEICIHSTNKLQYLSIQNIQGTFSAKNVQQVEHVIIQQWLPLQKHPGNNPCEAHTSRPGDHPTAVTLTFFKRN